MSKVILHMNGDNLVMTAPNLGARFREWSQEENKWLFTETEAAFLERIKPAGGVVVDKADIPDAKGFPDALELVEGNVQFSMSKAENMHSQSLLKQIYAKLDKLDAKMIRPIGEGDTARIAQINQQKEDLRNIMANPLVGFTGTTPEELKAYVPAELEV